MRTCTHFMTHSRCRSARSPRQLHSSRSAEPLTNSSCRNSCGCGWEGGNNGKGGSQTAATEESDAASRGTAAH